MSILPQRTGYYVPWPDKIPCDPIIQFWPYSLKMSMEGMSLLLPRTAQTYVELGSYCGASAQTACEIAPQARVYCIDPWDGRGSVSYESEYKGQLAELFQANLWPWRDRVTMLRTTSHSGLITLYCAGIQPDLIYIDADHTYPAVKDDLTLSMALFPNALICGDDFMEEAVQRAVREVLDVNFGVIGCSFWWRLQYKTGKELGLSDVLENASLLEETDGYKPQDGRAYCATVKYRPGYEPPEIVQ